jgi:hypothetical protein
LGKMRMLYLGTAAVIYARERPVSLPAFTPPVCGQLLNLSRKDSNI